MPRGPTPNAAENHGRLGAGVSPEGLRAAAAGRAGAMRDAGDTARDSPSAAPPVRSVFRPLLRCPGFLETPPHCGHSSPEMKWRGNGPSARGHDTHSVSAVHERRGCGGSLRFLRLGRPPLVALYSFRGHNGQGVSAMLDGKTLVVKMVAGQGVVQHVEVPFADYVEKMKREWVHLCIVHAKKMVFKDKLTVYVDGKSVFNGNLGYPDPLAMVCGRNTIGVEPLVDGLKGKLWSPTLFGVALSEAEVQKLHWLTHWKNDLNSVAAENAGLTDKSKFCFCYDARSCDLNKRICYDVSGNDCHGSLGPGTSAYVTQSFIHALDSVGGCACFLLLLLDQIPEMADFHPTYEFGMGEISDLLAFVGSGLRHSTVCRSHFVRLHGVKVVEFILQSISPSYLSLSLLDGVVSILEAITDYLESDEEIVEYIYRLLFFNTSWFLSPFGTQTKLLGEVLPKYLQILQKASLREQGRISDIGSPQSGKLVVSRAASLSEFSRSLDAKDQVDVSFFCRLISQVYMPVQDPAADQWHQLVAYIFRQCDISSGKRSCDGDNADIEEILQYLTQNLASAEPRKGAVGLPSRQLQLTTSIFKLSKGTVRALWRPMLSTNYNVRLAALRLFELYTSDKVLLHKSDMLMLYSSFQAHTLTADVADLLVDIVIGRKRLPHGNSKSSAEVRTGSFARMTCIPLVLLGLVHNGSFDVQAHVLTEIRVQLASPTMGDSVKEAIRSWPSWMSRLRSLTLGASVAAAAHMNDEIETTQERSLTQSEKLNRACGLLSAEFTSAFTKLEAIETIAVSGDVSACDFALSLIQNRNQNEIVTSAIMLWSFNIFRSAEFAGGHQNTEMLKMNDAILSPGQQAILSRKAFELWQIVLPHLSRINWDGLVANLVQNADYGSGVTPEETEIFTHLVASRSQSMVLALQVAIRYVTLAQTSGTNDVDLVQKFHNVLEMLKLIASLPVATASQRFSGPLSPLSGSSSPGVISPPHTMEFNPYLIQQHASSQAEVLGNELQQCEILWKEITDEDEAAEAARANEQDTASESRVVELKRSTEKFASSVHKLLAHSSHDSRSSLVGEGETSANSGEEGKTQPGGDGVILKIDSRENNFRMRLRLKTVTEDYRARNLSCEYPASSLTDTESKESGRRVGRRFRGSMEGGLADLEHSWRSDAGSDYSDFLADAKMRAAIIRSLSNPEEYESAYGGESDDDDLDAEDMNFYDAEEDDDIYQQSSGSQQKEIEAETIGASNFAKVAPSGPVEAPDCDATQSSAAPIAVPGSAEASSSPSPVASLIASPPASAFSLGASVLTVVGGVADYFQKSVKDAKDAVEYGVDSLYTTKDVVSEEAQALMQEVSTYIDSTPGSHVSHVMAAESLISDVPSLELTPSSLKMMETKLASDKVDDSPPELFPSSPSARNARQCHEGGAKRSNATSKVDLLVNAQLVRHLHVVEGKLILSNSSLRFMAERVVDEHETVVIEKKPGVPVDKAWRFLFKRRRWKIDDVCSKTASSEQFFRNSPMSTRWIQHEISTFEYIMWLNTIAGRTYNDLTQYPVFPWIISDYESATLDLSRRGAFRDLSKPMGALEPSRLKFYVDRYNAFEDPDIPKFMYGTHYSNIGAVLYYLIRLEPFTSYALSIQGGKFDHADRLFHSVAETWNNCLTDYTDLKELTPEWFYLPEFLVNCNGLELGTRQNGSDVNNVVLPPWAPSPEDFVMKNLVLSSPSSEPNHRVLSVPHEALSHWNGYEFSSGGDQSSEFIELQDRKSRKVLGEKRSLSNQLNVSNSIAFLHGGMVICTVGHHDFSARFHSTADGALLYRLLQHQSVVTCVNTSNLGTMLALGCTDGTISVWKVASMNSTLLDSLKIFRGSRVSSKPVHANDYSADQVLLGHNAQINCVSASDELGVCISGSASNECLVHDLEDGSILHSFDVPGHLEPGVISLALSNVGHVVVQSMGTGAPMLYSFHLNGTLMAQLSLGDRPMTSLSICARYSKVVVSNSAQAMVMTAHTLDDQRVLLEQDVYGEISSQGVAPNEMHAVFGVGSGKIVCLPLLPPQLPLHRTEI
ncbi:protein of unknown function DUF4704 [Phytophthora cactorum]|nr:protein of unknown function DUF4704 [Phytophthora cactorum]